MIATQTAWPPLRPHYLQCRAWAAVSQGKRFVNIAAGRGSGKTELARRFVVRMLPVKKPWPDPIYFYALPTYNQAKRIAWEPIKRLVPREWIKKLNESELYIDTIFGSRLYLLGMDNPARAEGWQVDGGVVDEACDQKPGSFDRTLVPCFSHRFAWCWRIGVPKRFGIGAPEFKSFYDKGVEGHKDIASFTWDSATVLTEQQIEFARSTFDARDFNEQYCARWETAAGAIYFAFSKANIRDDLCVHNPNKMIFVGCDFNVDPMCWIVGQKTDDGTGFLIIDELCLRNTNTQETLNVLFKRYGKFDKGIVFFGDASSRNRHSSATATDYMQIFNDKRWKNCEVNFPLSNPAILDRYATCNAMFCNAAGMIRCFVHSKCKRLIADCEGGGYKPGTREADATDKDMGHASDAFGYVMVKLFPMHAVSTSMPSVHY